MSAGDRRSALAALAVLLAASALQPVFTAAGWVPRTAGAVLAVGAASAAARRSRLAPALQPLATLLALAAYLVLVFVPGSLLTGTPGLATWSALHALLRRAGDDLALYATPAPATTPLVLLVVAGVGLVAVAVDTLAAVAARPAVAGLPLLALFAVPSALLPDGAGWLPFVLGASGWLVLLLAEGREDTARWGTGVPSPAATGPGAGSGRVGRRIGGAALSLAVVVPALVPGLSGRLFAGIGDGTGASGGSHSITTYNPITRLRGELTLPNPVQVLHYRTDDPFPDYLRMTTLGLYDGNGWRQDVLRGNLRENGVGDPIPTPAGQSPAATRRTVDSTISIDDLDAFWLPLPPTPELVQADGPWMWDAPSESVFATRSNTSRVGTYTVHSSRVLPDPATLAAEEGTPPPEVARYATPVAATDAVRSLTARVVRGQTTDYGRADALQAFFRDPASRFTYSETTTTGGSPDALQDFLQQRRGYCEQYASAMAAMLRLAGVPSRVAVGFTPGTRQADGSYAVTTSEAHAWPEAWFQGAGWVRFEPTPSRGGIRAAAVRRPAGGRTRWSQRRRPGCQRRRRGGGRDPGRAGRAPARRAGGPHVRARRPGSCGSRHAHRAAGPGAERWPGAAAARRALAAAPACAGGAGGSVPGPGTAWVQLADDATDNGHDWRPADSPRSAAARLLDQVPLDGPAAAGLARLSAAVEQERYGRPGAARPDGAALRHDSDTLRHALRADLPALRRLRAAVLPPSTLRWASSRLGTAGADLLDTGDRALGALAARLRNAGRPRRAS